MTATPSRIGFVTQPYRRAVSQTASVVARHGSLARETDDPLETYFTTVADAQARADERQALLSPDRRLFTIDITDAEDMVALLEAEEIPTVRFIDEEKGLEMLAIVTEVIIDADAQSAQVTVWG